jgi:hypothetical protein
MSAAGASKAMQRHETITGCGELLTFPQNEMCRKDGDHGLRPNEPDSSVRLGEAHFECGPGTCGHFAVATGGDGLSAAKRHERERGLRADCRLNRSHQSLGSMGAVQYNRLFLEGRARFLSSMRVCIFFP